MIRHPDFKEMGIATFFYFVIMGVIFYQILS